MILKNSAKNNAKDLCLHLAAPIVGATLVVAIVGGCPNYSNVFCNEFITGRHKASPYIKKIICATAININYYYLTSAACRRFIFYMPKYSQHAKIERNR
jgi:hypothetical protein